MKILLAIDDSACSRVAARMLISQNRPSGSSVRVLHVVEPIQTPYYPELIPPYPASLTDIERQRTRKGRALAERTARTLQAAGFQTTAAIRNGQARTTIVDAAAKWRANLIVMGSHGRTGLARLLLGSVAEYVVRHAPCSVQIVRARRR